MKGFCSNKSINKKVAYNSKLIPWNFWIKILTENSRSIVVFFTNTERQRQLNGLNLWALRIYNR